MTSYTKITQIIKFSILSLATRQNTRKIASTQILKAMFRDKTKTLQLVLFCTFVVILYLVTSCPVEILLNNAESAIRPASSLGDLRWCGNHNFPVFAEIRSSLGITNPFRSIMQPFREIIQPFRGSTHSFRTIIHNTICCQRVTPSIPPRLYHSSSHGKLTLLVE